MRLLNVETFQLEEFFYAAHPPYAILSHTWGKDSDEVSFRDVVDGRLSKPEARPMKLSGCCKQAKEDGYKYVWIDTCCIDKTNSVELQEAINSMFRWYGEAGICYAFLSDVSAGDPRDPQSRFLSSNWFCRGWTLQELLAPPNVRFYASDWRHLGTKGDLCDVIEQVTGVPTQFLLGITDLHQASVAQRMSWASGRATKRKEDIAYSLLGIFGINMPMIYGEGERAFRRLQEQIMKDIGDDSILAWGLDLNGSVPGSCSASMSGGSLAATPTDFANCGQVTARERPSRNFIDVLGGSLRLQLFLLTTSAGETLGLLTCGAEHNSDRVVAIPLTTSSSEPSGEYTRTKGRRALLIQQPVNQLPAQLVQIRIDGERTSSTGPSEPYWFRVQKLVSDVELIDVEPHSRWHRERGLIQAIAEPDSNSLQRTLVRLRHKTDESLDFMVMLEVETQSSKLQARYHVMIASRYTSLQEVARKFGDMRLEAFGKQSASNGILYLHVTLEQITKQRIFVITVDTLHNSPPVSVNATLELQYLGLTVAIECIQKVEEKEALIRKHLSRDHEQVSTLLVQIKDEQKLVGDQVRKLRDRELLLAKKLEDAAQYLGQLNATSETMNEQQNSMSAQRLEMQRRLSELQNSKLTTIESSEKLIAEEDRTLCWAASRGHEAIVQILLDRGANVAARDRLGRTPLHLAAKNGYEAIVQILLDRDADIAAKNLSDDTPLHLAALEGKVAVVQILLDRGADIEAKGMGGVSSLHVAASQRNEAVVQVLLDRGADIVAKDDEDLTPLHSAARNGHEVILRILLERGANFAARDRLGRTPLDLASSRGRKALVSGILYMEAVIAAKGQQLERPPEGAIKRVSKAVAHSLDDTGVDVSAKKEGRPDLFPAKSQSRIVVDNQYSHVPVVQSQPQHGGNKYLRQLFFPPTEAEVADRHHGKQSRTNRRDEKKSSMPTGPRGLFKRAGERFD